MKTFSEELREARQAKGLTLEELAHSTKISFKVLKAIETGDFDVLPQTYIKGFLRSYAQEVGLDAAEVVRKYEIHLRATDAIFSQPRAMVKKASKRSSWYLWGAIIGVLILLLLGLLVLRREEQGPRQIPAEIEEDTVSSPPVSAQPIEADTQVVARSEEDRPQQNGGGGTEIVGQGQHEVTEPVGLTLSAEAVSDTWLRVLADGDDLYEGIMKAGVSATWRAESLFELKIGKARGVRLVLNGQPLGELGDPDKVVKKLVLDRDGIVTKVLR